MKHSDDTNEIRKRHYKENNSAIKDSKNSKINVKKKSRKLMKTVVITLLILIIASFTVLGYKIQQNGGGLSGLLATVLGESQQENLEPIQFLVMGVSGVDDYKLADTIMVVSYNPKTQIASLMSIPRDTYVGKKSKKTASSNYLASYKINTVFRNGTNIPEAIDRINDLTYLELNNYIIIDTNALVKLVDAIGGVTFDVPIDMDYDDDSQDLHIHLTSGEQLIDGAKAEQLLRFRHNNDGSTYSSEYGQQDLGRMKTQREFVTATLNQTLKPQNIFKIKQIMDIMSQNVTTNMDVTTLKKYIPYAVNFSTDNLKTGVLPGEPETCNGVALYIASSSETHTLVEDLFGENGTNSMPAETNTATNNTTTNTTSKSKTNSTKTNTSTNKTK